MALQSNGQISIDDIFVELGYSSGHTDSSLSTATNLAQGSSTITNTPDLFSDWYSYSHCSDPFPNPPGSRTAAKIGPGIIKVAWGTNPDADNYTHRRSTNGSSWTNETTTSSLSYSTSLPTGNWYWQVRSNNCSGNSSWGNMSPYPFNLT